MRRETVWRAREMASAPIGRAVSTTGRRASASIRHQARRTQRKHHAGWRAVQHDESSAPLSAIDGGKALWCKVAGAGTDARVADSVAEALARGVDTFLFDAPASSDARKETAAWLDSLSAESPTTTSAPPPRALFAGTDRTAAGFFEIFDADDVPAAKLARLERPDEVATLMDTIAGMRNDTVVVSFAGDGTDALWRVIPAENLVAAKGGAMGLGPTLMAVASTADDARTMLGALESGVDGIVFDLDAQTPTSASDGPSPVAEVADLIAGIRIDGGPPERLVAARVTEVVVEGQGDRVCVDLCEALAPGEGMLVGSFCRGLFLVHSECDPSAYINSRPFRVNAGPVCAYVKQPMGKTAYLSELRSGHEALVVDAMGRTRQCTVGRLKIERRPLVRVAAVTASGAVVSAQLQHAETVKLVRPLAGGGREGGVDAVAVTELKVGDEVLVVEEDGARHTGILVDEMLEEV